MTIDVNAQKTAKVLCQTNVCKLSHDIMAVYMLI